MVDSDNPWIKAIIQTIESYYRTIDATISQLTDEELARRPTEDMNSVAVILRHLGGNLRSRWTDFLTTDGEKPDRNRETEFRDWDGDRESLLAHFHHGWACFTNAVDQITPENISTAIYIRGEEHSIPQAIGRSLTHIAYHVGQIVLIARMVHEGEWKWLTIPPGQSEEHNQRTWGTASSRSVFGGTADRE